MISHSNIWEKIIRTASPAWTSYQILVFAFALIILLGSFLLSLPISSKDGVQLDFIDALFTSASAVCVTGLSVVEVGETFSVFGQVVLISLVQIGGLGIITATTLISLLLGKRIQLKERLTLQESLNYESSSGVIRLVLYIIKLTLAIEFIGGTALVFFMLPDYGLWSIYLGYWHAISAFCNAGFDVLGQGNSFARYVSNVGISMTLSFLIILGGFGFFVINDILRKRNWKNLEAQSKLIIIVTFSLLTFGTFGVFFLEYSNAETMGSFPIWQKFLASFTQASVSRTAGFSTVNIVAFQPATIVMIIGLMFIGTAPGSTGGGIKTNTFGIIIAAVLALVKGKKEVVVFYRTVPQEIVYRSFILFFIYSLLVLFVTWILSIFEPFPFLHLLFETTSAFSTTGLSMNISSSFSDIGKLFLIFVMFVGRVGMLTFVMAFTRRRNQGFYHYPDGKFRIG